VFNSSEIQQLKYLYNKCLEI